MQRRGQTSIQYYEQTKKTSETPISTKSHVLTSQAAIVKIEPASTAERDVLAIQEDGTLTAFSSDGAAIKHQCLLNDSQTPVKLMAVQCLSRAEAESSVLKSRQDLMSIVPEGAVFVAAAYQSRGAKDLHLGIWAFAIAAASAHPSTSLEPLVRHEVDQQKSGSVKKASVEFTSGNKKLEISTTTSVTTFDITTIVPQMLSQRKHFVPDLLSSLDLNSDITFCLVSGKLQVYSKKFSALQASSSLNHATLKRKRDGDDTSRMTLVAYFSQMRRVLASNGNQLLAIDIYSRAGNLDPFKQGSLLIGNILRGNDTHEPANRSTPHFTCSIGNVEREQQIKDWPIISKDLDVLAEQEDARGFDERFKTAFNLQKPKNLNSSKLPESKLNYLLSKIFASESTATDATSQPIKIVLLLPELLRWCISSGLLEISRISAALKLNQTVITSTAVAQAIMDVDPQHELLEYYVQHSPFIQPEVLTFIARHLVNRALRLSEVETQNLLTDSTRTDADNLAPAQHLLLRSRPDGMSTSNPTFTCLAHVLRRLAFAGSAIVSERLRVSSFRQSEILALIQFLRQQLFLGGYSRLGEMRNYPSPPASAAGEECDGDPAFQRQISLQGIVTLLDACIDALGPVGVLGSSAEEGAFIEKMVPELLTEVISASQAVEDSALLQGILRETLRYAESVERQPFEVRSKVENKATNSVGKGQIVTLYSEPESAEPGSLSGSALPLSLKAEQDIEKFKVRKGGQMQRRSAREMGMLKDRLKSPYSFERLEL